MIGLLRGHLLESEPNGSFILDVAGVGYELIAPLGTLGRVTRHDDDTLVLHVHTNVREDALELYGFASRVERTAFRTLISISKVGPKLALSVLSCVSVKELTQLVESGQSGRLTKIPGVGKKTAERMALELKGKLTGLMSGGVAPLLTGKPGAAVGGKGPLLQQALLQLGFKPAQVDAAVAAVGDLERPLDELLRDALAQL